MKTLKLVLGILCIVLSVLVLLQSCAAGLSNTLSENGEVGGSAGALTAILMMAGGIVMIATRSGGKGGSIAGFILYLLAGLLGCSLAGSYSDLKIWGGLSFIIAVINLIAILTAGKEKESE